MVRQPSRVFFQFRDKNRIARNIGENSLIMASTGARP